MSIKIIADSTCYLPQEYIDKYKISIASLNVLINGNSYRETDLSNDWFYNEMAKSSTIPTSSQPSIEELYNIVESIVKNGDDVVGIFLSSDMSGTFSTSNLVKNMIIENYPNAKIVMIDSRSNCMQAGFAVLEAAKAANENKSLDEVVSIAKNVIKNSKFIFVPETLDYLKKGGRIGRLAGTVGELLNLKHIITTDEDGVFYNVVKVRGRKQSLSKMTELLKGYLAKGKCEVAVLHAGCEDEAIKYMNSLKDLTNVVSIKIAEISPSLGIHGGPGLMGFSVKMVK